LVAARTAHDWLASSPHYKIMERGASFERMHTQEIRRPQEYFYSARILDNESGLGLAAFVVWKFWQIEMLSSYIYAKIFSNFWLTWLGQWGGTINENL
jgi:hypothetical protein